MGETVEAHHASLKPLPHGGCGVRAGCRPHIYGCDEALGRGPPRCYRGPPMSSARRAAFAAVLTAVLALAAAPAGARHRRRECQTACRDSIERCVTSGVKRAPCRRAWIRWCMRRGPVVCEPPPPTTSTTTLPRSTTTTRPPVIFDTTTTTIDPPAE